MLASFVCAAAGKHKDGDKMPARATGVQTELFYFKSILFSFSINVVDRSSCIHSHRVDVNSLPKTVARQRRGCDLNPGPSAPESSTLTARLPTMNILPPSIVNFSSLATFRNSLNKISLRIHTKY